MSSSSMDRHEALARAINEVEMVTEEELMGVVPVSFYRWQRPGQHVASELLFHLNELGYDVVRKKR